MQDSEMLPLYGVADAKTWNKSSSSQYHSQRSNGNGVQNLLQPLPLKDRPKVPKRKNNVSSLIQHSDKSTSDTLATTFGNDYRVLRRKYMLLEEESLSIARQLEQVEDETRALEDEKLALLDQLVVLEGLIDPPS